MSNLGAADVDSRLEEQLIDGILYAFQEQTNEVGCFLALCSPSPVSACLVRALTMLNWPVAGS